MHYDNRGNALFLIELQQAVKRDYKWALVGMENGQQDMILIKNMF